jgi:hypothetical protein
VTKTSPLCSMESCVVTGGKLFVSCHNIAGDEPEDGPDTIELSGKS